MTEKIKVMIPEEDVAKRIEEIGKRVVSYYKVMFPIQYGFSVNLSSYSVINHYFHSLLL